MDFLGFNISLAVLPSPMRRLGIMGIKRTVVLDEDVLERVREMARAEGVPFKTKLNDLVRDGLAKANTNKREKFVVKAFDMGGFLLPFPIKVSHIDAMEDEERMREMGWS